MSSIARDLRHAVRSLLRRPGFSLVVILTLAAGIGANATLFTFLREVSFPTYGLPDQDRLAHLVTRTPRGEARLTSYPDLLDYRAALGEDAELFAWRIFGATLRLDRSDEGNLFAWGEAVEPGHFALFGGPVTLGRDFLPADARPGAPRVAVLHHRFWQRRYGGDPNVLGHRLSVNGHAYTLVGVTPKGFQSHGMTHELYIPVSHLDDVLPGVREDRAKAAMIAMLVLGPGLSVQQAEARLTAAAGHLDDTAPLDSGARHPELSSVRQGDDYFQKELAMLMTAVGLLLLLASANVANLMLARCLERRREMAIHAALGAGRRRLVRRLLAEGLTLSALGGLAGLVLADPLSRVLESYLIGGPVGVGNWGEGSRIFVVDHEIAFFTLALSLLVGLVFSIAPALHAWRLDLISGLKSGADGAAAGRFGLRQILATAQVAISVVLLLAAGLLVRSVVAAQEQEAGFDTDRLLLATLFVAPRATADGADRRDEDERRHATYGMAVERLEALPGVSSVTLASQAPLSGWLPTAEMADPSRPEEIRDLGYLEVGAGFFSTLGVPLELGRTITDRDRGAQPAAAVVNRKLADLLWPGENPLGRALELRRNDRTALRVVGVVADFRNKSVLEQAEPQVYALPTKYRRLTLILRTTGLPQPDLAETIRRTLAGLRGDVSLVDLAPFQAQIDYSLQDRRMVSDTASLLGVLGLLLAATGIFSVMSYLVSSRRFEIGIRMAVGATSADVRWMVLAHTLALVAVGIAIGLAAAGALTHFLRSQLFGVGIFDPVTFLAVPLILTLTALVATLLPASRAAGVEPKSALLDS